MPAPSRSPSRHAKLALKAATARGRWTAGRRERSLVRGHSDRFSEANPNG